MCEVKRAVVAANREFARDFGTRRGRASRPARRMAILTCMDARLDPPRFAGLSPGEAHIIRNAGGRASNDAIRSLIISHMLLGTREWFVIHHTDCGMQRGDDGAMDRLLSSKLHPGGGNDDGTGARWLTFVDLEQSVIDDVTRIRRSPLVPAEVSIYGYCYDVSTGLLREVEEATRIGAPTAQPSAG